MIKLIVGLANPGAKYISTRHNAGAWYVNLLTKWYKKILTVENKFHGYTGRLTFGGQDVFLLVPTTFMNFSGTAVEKMITFYQIEPKDILIAHDELDLLPGSTRLKIGGGHSGHNGLKDIINRLGNNSHFYRLRIGIGHPGNKKQVMDFVLGKPPIREYRLICSAINEAVLCTEIIINQDTVKAMNRLHKYHPI